MNEMKWIQIKNIVLLIAMTSIIIFAPGYWKVCGLFLGVFYTLYSSDKKTSKGEKDEN